MFAAAQDEDGRGKCHIRVRQACWLRASHPGARCIYSKTVVGFVCRMMGRWNYEKIELGNSSRMAAFACSNISAMLLEDSSKTTRALC